MQYDYKFVNPPQSSSRYGSANSDKSLLLRANGSLRKLLSSLSLPLYGELKTLVLCLFYRLDVRALRTVECFSYELLNKFITKTSRSSKTITIKPLVNSSKSKLCAASSFEEDFHRLKLTSFEKLQVLISAIAPCVETYQ